MKHPLPQVFPRDLFCIAVTVVVLVFVASPATAQDSSQHEHHRGSSHGADAALHVEAHVVPYSITNPNHHTGDAGDAAIVYNMPLRQPTMSVSEVERILVGRLAFGRTVVDAGQGAVLKTTTFVPE
jgi:hypothetical protein